MNDQELSAFIETARGVFAGVESGLSMGDEEAQATRIRQWLQTLADVSHADAARCLTAMHSGDADHGLKFPGDWADRFPAFVRRWCRSHAPPQVSAPIKCGEPERFRCLPCRDRGTVTAVNPTYVDTFRERLEAFEPIDHNDKTAVADAREWFAEARTWCRSAGAGPLIAAVTCQCDARGAEQRRLAIREQTTIGCLFNAKRMPVTDGYGALAAHEACRIYVAEYEMDEAHEWAPG